MYRLLVLSLSVAVATAAFAKDDADDLNRSRVPQNRLHA